MVNVADTIVTAGISAAMSVLTGVVTRIAIEKKYERAQNEAEEARKDRIRYTELRSEWMWAAGRVFYHLVRWAQGKKQPNGDLDASFCDLQDIEKQIKGLDRQRSAEIQEE